MIGANEREEDQVIALPRSPTPLPVTPTELQLTIVVITWLYRPCAC